MPRSTRSSLVRPSEADPAVSSVSNKPIRATRLSAVTIANSSDNEEIPAFESPVKRSVFKGVIVTPRLTREAIAKGKGKVKAGSSTASSISPVMSTRDTSVDRAETTPATSLAQSAYSSDAEVITKRKRMTTTQGKKRMDETAQDEEIARAMQEQEYDSEEVVPVQSTKRGGRKRASAVNDSAEESPLSELDMDSDGSLDFQPAIKRQKLTKRKSTASNPRSASRRAPAKVSKRNSKKPIALDSDEEVHDLVSDESDFVVDDLVDESSGLSDAPVDDPEEVGQEETMTAAVKTMAKNRRRGKLVKRWKRRGDDEEPYDRRVARRKKLEKAHPEIKTMWQELEKVPIITPVEAVQPATITRRLKGFQLEGLNWMMRQEQSSYKGGLLGDEMGMGKTIQAVSLIMSDHPAKDPTLVLVPPVAMMQWAAEIKEYTKDKLNVLVCHGTNTKTKDLTTKIIRSYDVVIMSYNSLESMYRKQEKGWTRGDNIIKEDSPIHAVNFHRLILDEAHSIKSRNTGVAKACFALQGKYKWCLSGTPVQNRIGEFFSLLRFLEVRPFADYFCEACPCAELHWSIDADYYCKSCKHSSSEHRSVFNEELLNPITGESMKERSAAMARLHMITARVMLRRLKKDHTSSMELPPKEIVIHNEFFGAVERDFSSSIMSNTTREFDTYVARGVMLNNYANIFGLIMQMRQVANHPDLLLKKHSEGGQNILICEICDEPAEEAIKSKCRHEFCRQCAKTYVQSCEGNDSDADCPRCHIPLVIHWDQPDIEQDEEQVKKSSIINRIKMDNWTSSTKIEMLVYDLYKLRSKKQTLKSIVFSQFTSMLQLIEWRLRRAGFNTVMLDGSMTPAQRQKSIDYFMNNTDVEVFLVSLKAGGVALNLTEASRVFIVDPWWNPAAEWQSADRCHRIGQTRPCVITRLVVEDSVESRMVMLQEKKASMISASINNDKVAMDKLSPEDLQFLFRGT